MHRSIFIRLLPDELLQLREMANEQRRSPQEQAAFLVSQGLLQWQARKDLAAELSAGDRIVELTA